LQQLNDNIFLTISNVDKFKHSSISRYSRQRSNFRQSITSKHNDDVSIQQCRDIPNNYASNTMSDRTIDIHNDRSVLTGNVDQRDRHSRRSLSTFTTSALWRHLTLTSLLNYLNAISRCNINCYDAHS